MPSQAAERPAHPLGFPAVLALVVGTFIGSGIFLLPAQLAPYGWNSLFGWLVTISGAIALAYLFAVLARALPRAAGPYAYVGEAFGHFPAFIVAWAYWVSIFVGNAAIAIAAVSYLSALVPALDEIAGLGALTAVLLVWTLTLINCLSLRAGGTVQLLTTLLKLMPLLAVVVIAAAQLAGDHATALPPMSAADLDLSSVNAAAAITLWALLGFEAASIGARTVRDPGRTVPRAMVVGTLVVGLVYLLTATPVTLMLPAGEVAQSNAPFALFVGEALGPVWGNVVGLFVAVSVMGALNGLILISGEFPRAWAADRTFPAWFARVSSGGIAVRAILLSSVLTTLLIWAGSDRTLGGLFAFMALLSTTGALVLYLACALAVLRLQRTRLLSRSPWISGVALFGILYALWTLVGAGGEATGLGALLLAIGAGIYLVMRARGRSSPGAAES